MFHRHRHPPEGSRTAHPHEHISGDEQVQLILDALGDLRDTTVREVMTPRVDVAALPIPVHASDVARAVRESGHSRFPVYDDDLDHLIGVLFVNDLFRTGWEVDQPPSPPSETGGAPSAATQCAGNDDQVEAATSQPHPSPLDISRRLRQPYLVPESRLVLDVLAEMRHNRKAFAVVVDEYGGVAGVLTVKDLLSELVGDLHDELDRTEEPDVIRVDRKRWLVDGGTSVDELEASTGLRLPEGEYVTLGGFLFDAFGHIPAEGESLHYNGWELRVVEMDRRRVGKVVLQVPPDGDMAGGGADEASGGRGGLGTNGIGSGTGSKVG
ncbi:MAG: hemolysin family protein [Acidimicrobiales bacterium]